MDELVAAADALSREASSSLLRSLLSSFPLVATQVGLCPRVLHAQARVCQHTCTLRNCMHKCPRVLHAQARECQHTCTLGYYMHKQGCKQRRSGRFTAPKHAINSLFFV